MADKVGQAEEKERRLNRSRKKLERKLVSFGCCVLQWTPPLVRASLDLCPSYL